MTANQVNWTNSTMLCTQYRHLQRQPGQPGPLHGSVSLPMPASTAVHGTGTCFLCCPHAAVAATIIAITIVQAVGSAAISPDHLCRLNHCCNQSLLCAAAAAAIAPAAPLQLPPG
eukprot:GHRR01014939.1.p3 GENE.GHRR01014939.1~~GHRR01014939.1.p3  ORF type:complete len:115 (-),score=36.13 GHRR01014939.1:247-591(-)